jgi:adenosylcobinamide-GDP ribazoletransferase
MTAFGYNVPMPESPDNNAPEQPDSPAPPGEPAANQSVITVRAPSPENMWTEIVVALNYLTRLNLALREEPKPRLIRKSMTWFPVIGALIGIFGAAVDWIMSMIGLPGIVTATFAVISMLWATRAMHEEEFAKLANQYGQILDKEQKLGWLREERSVRYGTLAVVLVIIMKIGAIASLANNDIVFQGLIVGGCWSRAIMVVVASWLRPLPGDPVAEYFQQPPALRVIVAVILGVVLTFAVLSTYAAEAMAVGALTGLVVALLGAYYIRGYSGPLMGTLQQVVELSVLGVILAVQ